MIQIGQCMLRRSFVGFVAFFSFHFLYFCSVLKWNKLHAVNWRMMIVLMDLVSLLRGIATAKATTKATATKNGLKKTLIYGIKSTDWTWCIERPLKGSCDRSKKKRGVDKNIMIRILNPFLSKWEQWRNKRRLLLSFIKSHNVFAWF